MRIFTSKMRCFSGFRRLWCQRSEPPGTGYSYAGECIGQGRENTRIFLKENKDIFAKLDTELRKKLNVGAVKADVPEVPATGPAEAEEAVRGRKG